MDCGRSLRQGATSLVLALLLVLAACAPWDQAHPQASPTASAAPSATNTPALSAIPPIHSLSLGSYQTDYALPGKSGIVLVPKEPPGFGGISSLSFYRYSTKQVEKIATAPTFPDGMPGGIPNVQFGGDWVTYLSDDARMQRWILWAYNVTTRERVEVDSEAMEGKGVFLTTSNWLNSSTDLYLSLVKVTDGHFTTTLRDFSFATRQSTILYTDPAFSLLLVAMNNTAFLFTQGDASGQNFSMWLLKRGEATPRQISTQHGNNATMNDRYAIWDEPHSQTITVYDLQTGQETQHRQACIRPVIDATRPYVVCYEFSAHCFVLVPLSGGFPLQFANDTGYLPGDGQIYDGRVFWVGSSNSAIFYFDLPAQ